MSAGFKYWDDCVDPQDMQLLWADGTVSKEWIDANEKMGRKVLISRDPDGQLYLTQTEMRVICLLNVLNDYELGEDLISTILALSTPYVHP